MCDEGIAIKVAERICDNLKEIKIETIVGETDAEYCIDKINENDFLFILDATYYGISPGSITIIPLSEMYTNYSDLYSQHEVNLVHSLKTCGKNVDGFVVGIEICEIKFDTNLSKVLNTKFNTICKKVHNIIVNRFSQCTSDF